MSADALFVDNVVHLEHMVLECSLRNVNSVAIMLYYFLRLRIYPLSITVYRVKGKKLQRQKLCLKLAIWKLPSLIQKKIVDDVSRIEK